jgi:DNA ligase (NAD+)
MTMTDEAAAIALLQKYDRAYASNKPKISDAEYDKLRARRQKQYPKNPYFKTVGAVIASKQRTEIKLPIRMGSLEKYRPIEAIKWLTTLPKQVEITILPKWDGISILLEYINGKFKRAFTRGEDGITGFEVTNNIKYVQGVLPKFIRTTDYASAEGTSYIQVEVIIHKRLFAKHYSGKQIDGTGRVYKNERNFCGGMINRLNPTGGHIKALQHMTAIAYGMSKKINGKMVYFDKIDAITRLSLHGFTTTTLPVRHGGKFKPLENFWYSKPHKTITVALLNNLLTTWRERFDALQDGIVLDINQHSLRKLHGFDAARPGFARAVKPEVEDQISHNGKVKSVEINMSSRRIFVPVWILQSKLNFNGVEVDRITAHNCAQLKTSQAGPGATIKIIRSGDVIPFYVSTVTAAKVILPKICPDCATKLQWTHNKQKEAVNLFCPNNTCSGPQLRMLRRFFTVLKIDGMAKGVIEAMVNSGLDTVPKILTATSKQLAKVDGFGERKTTKIITGLREIVKSVPLEKLMKASGIMADETMGFGERRLAPIIKQLGRTMVLTGKINPTLMKLKLLQIDGIGERVADQFIENLPTFREFYREIINVVTLAKDNRGGKLAGKIIVFTGFRSAVMEKIITENGGIVGNGTTNKTSVVFSADDSNVKARNAAAKGIKIIPQAKADAYLTQMLKG